MTYKTICFTGHRKYNNKGFAWAALRLIIDITAKRGCSSYIVGGALGADLLAAQLVEEYRHIFRVREDNILPKLVLAKPFVGYDSRWSARDKKSWAKLCKKAIDEIVIIGDCPKYYQEAKYLYLKRDRWMVNRSDAVIAVWDERYSGGTYYTMKYAFDQGKPVYVINLKKQSADWVKRKQ